MEILAKLCSNFVEGPGSREIFNYFDADKDGKLNINELFNLLNAVRSDVCLTETDMLGRIGPIDLDAVRQKKDETGAVILERIWPVDTDITDYLHNHSVSFSQFLCLFKAQKPDDQLVMCFAALLETYKQPRKHYDDLGSVTVTQAESMVNTYFEKRVDRVIETVNYMVYKNPDAGERDKKIIRFEHFFKGILALWQAKHYEESKGK